MNGNELCLKIKKCLTFEKLRYNVNVESDRKEMMRIGVMAAQQTLTLLVEVRVLYP